MPAAGHLLPSSCPSESVPEYLKEQHAFCRTRLLRNAIVHLQSALLCHLAFAIARLLSQDSQFIKKEPRICIAADTGLECMVAGKGIEPLTRGITPCKLSIKAHEHAKPQVGCLKRGEDRAER
jgi:hypothetical protein